MNHVGQKHLREERGRQAAGMQNEIKPYINTPGKNSTSIGKRDKGGGGDEYRVEM